MRSSLVPLLRSLRAIAPMLMLGVLASACTTVPVVIQPALACTDFLPDHLKQHVPSATIPEGALNVGKLEDFGDAQTGQLDKANGRGDDIKDICAAVDAANKKAAKALAPRPWYKFW